MAGAYFDHNATTPLDPRVREEMLPWLEADRVGNPSSVHTPGQRAKEAVEAARCAVARMIGASSPEVVFMSSATEANNSVIASIFEPGSVRGHVVVSAVEHPSVAKPIERLAAEGLEVSWIRPDTRGRIASATMVDAIREDTCLVALVLANNIVGTVQPANEVAVACRERGVPVLCDAVQAVGKIPVDVGRLGVDYLTLSGHKFSGPMGAAALWIRPGARWTSLIVGGAQERRRRAGTVNVVATVGLGAAARIITEELVARRAKLRALRDRFEAGLVGLEDVTVDGAGAARLPNTSHLTIEGIDSLALLIRLDLRGYALSAGSACSSGSVEASPTLLAMGRAKSEALSALRVSFGVDNTAEQVDSFLAVLEQEVFELRRLAEAR